MEEALDLSFDRLLMMMMMMTPPPHQLLVKLIVYIMLPVLYVMQKSSPEQLRLADDLLLMTVWQVMTTLQNTAPDPGQTVQPSSRAPKLRAHQHYNKHI